MQEELHNKSIHLRITVAVIGTHHQVGTTHVATSVNRWFHHAEDMVISDLGVLWEGFSPDSYDKVLIVLRADHWGEEETLRYIRQFRKKENCIFICSGGSRYRALKLKERAGVPIFFWDYDTNVFHMSRDEWMVMHRLLE